MNFHPLEDWDDQYTYPYYKVDPIPIGILFPGCDTEHSFRGSPRLCKRHKSQRKVTIKTIKEMERQIDDYLPRDELDVKIYLKRRPENAVAIGKIFPKFAKAWKCTMNCFEDEPELISLHTCSTFAREKYWKELIEYFMRSGQEQKGDQNIVTACYAYLAASLVKFPVRLTDWEISYIIYYFNSIGVHPSDVPQIYHFLDEITCLLATGGYGCLSVLMQNGPNVRRFDPHESLLLKPPSLRIGTEESDFSTDVCISRKLFKLQRLIRETSLPLMTPVEEGVTESNELPLGKSVPDLIREENYRDAVTLATKLLEISKNKSELYFHRGMALMRMNKYTDALMDMQRSLSEPNSLKEAEGIRELLLKKLNIISKRDMIHSPKIVPRGI